MGTLISEGIKRVGEAIITAALTTLASIAVERVVNREREYYDPTRHIELSINLDREMLERLLEDTDVRPDSTDD